MDKVQVQKTTYRRLERKPTTHQPVDQQLEVAYPALTDKRETRTAPLAIEKLVDPEIERNYENKLLKRLLDVIPVSPHQSTALGSINDGINDAYPKAVRDLNSGHLICEVSVLPLLHQQWSDDVICWLADSRRIAENHKTSPRVRDTWQDKQPLAHDGYIEEHSQHVEVSAHKDKTKVHTQLRKIKRGITALKTNNDPTCTLKEAADEAAIRQRWRQFHLPHLEAPDAATICNNELGSSYQCANDTRLPEVIKVYGVYKIAEDDYPVVVVSCFELVLLRSVRSVCCLCWDDWRPHTELSIRHQAELQRPKLVIVSSVRGIVVIFLDQPKTLIRAIWIETDNKNTIDID
ncbi:hypothetical protein CLF_108644 [Clonorchis sinensis]|uniref:Uncharacterized protein n=1 Tax=Clonorchis sinensis TaxID=79923 RepID=G7YIB7_CLOSI|nr:hypothetical protein CLF_108644 [Clonorchis sinensis]